MVKDHTGYTFCNWARTLRFKPPHFYKPETEAEVIEVVKRALDTAVFHCGSGPPALVRTQGAGHSWSQLVLTTDSLVTLDSLLTVADPGNPSRGVPIVKGNGTSGNPTATVPAGIRLKNLTNLL